MDEQKLEQLMKKYEALVWTIVSGILGSSRRRDCEEAAADVFISLWHDNRFDPDADGAKSYIIHVAKRRAIDRLRAAGREAVLPYDICELNEPPCDSDINFRQPRIYTHTSRGSSARGQVYSLQ